MILGSARRPRSQARIGCAIHSLAHDAVDELRIVGNAGSRQMVRQGLQGFENKIDVLVGILDHKREGTEELLGQQLPLLLGSKVLERHLYGCRLVCSVDVWDAVVLERHSSEQ